MIPEEREKRIARGLQELAAVVTFERCLAERVPAAADRLRHIATVTSLEIARMLPGQGLR